MNLLLILGRASRFDVVNGEILAGPARQWFDSVIDQVAPGLSYEVLYVTDYLAGKKPITTPTHVLACGEECLALATFAGMTNIDTARGVVHVRSNVRVLLTYHPQDCCDMRDVDGDVFTEDGDSIEDSIDASNNAKDSAPTMRANYPFWFRADVEKLLDVRPVVYRDDFAFLGVLPSDEAARTLKAIPANSDFFFDIETHPKTESVQVFSWACNNGPVYTYVVYDFRGKLTSGAVSVMVQLARVLERCNVVIHNACFDLTFLAIYHAIPFGSTLSDTMLMWHRLFPESEKSLAHVISYFTNFAFHKDESGSFDPRNYTALTKLATYNAKDVHRLRLIYYALNAERAKDAGLDASMTLANQSIYPYILASIRGFELDTTALRQHKDSLAKRLDFLTRVFRILVGCAPFNPGSPKQLAEYLYDGMGYKPPEKSDAGAPSTSASSIYKLLLKHPENVALTTLLKIRTVSKQLSMLGFKPFTPFKRR